MGTTDEIFQLVTILNGKVEETAPQIIIPIALQKGFVILAVVFLTRVELQLLTWLYGMTLE